MTIHEVSTQLYNLALGHFLNGQKWTRQSLEHYIRTMFNGNLKLDNAIVLEICLRDGKWLMTVDRFSDAADGYDYYIPDDRDQEKRIWQMLTT